MTGLHYFERECKENKGEENERKGRTEVYHETIVQCGRNPNWSQNGRHGFDGDS